MYHEDDRGPQEWSGVHVTHRTTVAQLVDVDNVGPQGTLLAGFEMFRNAGENLDAVIQKARADGKRVLAIGSGWALSPIVARSHCANMPSRDAASPMTVTRYG